LGNLQAVPGIETLFCVMYNDTMKKADDNRKISEKPVGFFDSGVGGLSVLKTAYSLIPDENYVYYGDNLNAPYGEKTEEEIQALSIAAGAFLFDKGVKMIVVACNTATSAAIQMMREKFNLPVISMEPAVKPALAALKSGKVLVLATPATVTQARYLGLIERLNAYDRVISVGCGGLVELIEEGKTDEASIHGYLKEQLAFLRGERIGAVVLGCTHYSFVEKSIKSYIDGAFHTDCPMFDGRHGTARQLMRVLDEYGLRSSVGAKGRVEFFASRPDYPPQRFAEIFHNFSAD
jgi:glutamate racemase